MLFLYITAAMTTQLTPLGTGQDRLTNRTVPDPLSCLWALWIVLVVLRKIRE